MSLLLITSNVRGDNNFVCAINSQNVIIQCYRYPYGTEFSNTTIDNVTSITNIRSGDLSIFSTYRTIGLETGSGKTGRKTTDDPKSNKRSPVGIVDYKHIHVCEGISMRWAWALLLCVCTPYILTLLRSLRRIIFKETLSLDYKSRYNPDYQTVLWVNYHYSFIC